MDLRQRQLALAGTGITRLAERVGLTLTGSGLVGVVVVGWFTARHVGARALYLLVYTAVIVLVMSWFVARRRLALTVDRSSLPTRMRVGQIAAVELTVTAQRRVSTVMLLELLPSKMGRQVALPIPSLPKDEELVLRYSLAPSLRGVYEVGPTTVSWSDPFGLSTHTQTLAAAVEVIVHPQMEVARDRVLTRMWEDPPIRPPSSKPWPTGFEFYGMRDYVPGDDLRRVVWSVVAKTGKMMVRESEQGITDRVVIVIDNQVDWHAAGDPSETFENAIRAAASVGVQHLDDGFSLTLMTNDGVLVNALRGGHGHASFVFLDQLARLQMTSTPLSKIAFDLLDQAKHRPHFLVLTPHLSDGDAQQLKLIVDRGLSVVVAQLLWDESDPLTASRAAAVGTSIVQIEPGGSLAAAFAHPVGARAR